MVKHTHDACNDKQMKHIKLVKYINVLYIFLPCCWIFSVSQRCPAKLKGSDLVLVPLKIVSFALLLNKTVCRRRGRMN